MKKYCTKCGKPFEATGREVICPSCKQAAAEDAKRAAVLKAKRASWAGESVPVRISGRASTLIREFSKSHDVPFAESLDELLKNTPFFTSLGIEWSAITPYKSHRRDKATSTADTAQDKQDKQDETGKQEADKQEADKQAADKQAAGKQEVAKTTSKASTSKTAGKAASTSK